MKLGLSSLLFTCERLEESVEAAAELGYETVEVVYDMPHFMPDRKPELERIRKMIDERSLGVSVHASFWDLNPASYYTSLRRLTIKRVRESVLACRTLGGEILVVHPGKCPAPDVPRVFEGTARLYQEFLREIVPFAKKLGVLVCLENGNSRENPFSLLPELGELVERREIGITLDIPHAFLRYGPRNVERILKDLKRVKHLIRHIHIHDNLGHRDDHLIPGEGKLALEPVVECLKNSFTGTVIAELWNPENPWRTAREAKKRLEKLLG